MTMLQGSNEDRAQAIRAAAQLCAGTGSPPETMIFVADVALMYILQGTEVALRRAGAGPALFIPEQQDASAPQPSDVRTESSIGSPSAQTLADEAYRATTRAEVDAVVVRMTAMQLEDEMISINGVGGTLSGYLGHRYKDFAVSKEFLAQEDLRSELGL